MIKARADSRACPVVFLAYVCILFSAEIVISTDAVDTGMIQTRQVSRYNWRILSISLFCWRKWSVWKVWCFPIYWELLWVKEGKEHEHFMVIEPVP